MVLGTNGVVPTHPAVPRRRKRCADLPLALRQRPVKTTQAAGGRKRRNKKKHKHTNKTTAASTVTSTESQSKTPLPWYGEVPPAVAAQTKEEQDKMAKLGSFFAEYDPEKNRPEHIKRVLDQFKGREGRLSEMLGAKYGGEPHIV